MLQLVLALAAFAPPLSVVRPAPNVARASTPVALGGLFGGEEFRLFPSDVQFMDVDGDDVVLRPTGGKVDLFVNKKEVLSGAVMTLNADGKTLEVKGTVKKGFGGIVLPGFALEEIVVEGVVPRDPADLEAAKALIA